RPSMRKGEIWGSTLGPQNRFMNSRIRSPRVDPQISPFLIDGLELTLRPVQKYPQVIAVHSHLPANAVLILFFEEHSPQQVPVPSRQGGKDLPHVLGELLGHHHSLEVEDLIGNLLVRLINLLVLPQSPVVLQ